jgi:hypothetical protein
LSSPERIGLPTIGRWVAALLVLAVGAIHLKLYFGNGYRDIDKVGPSFLLNAVASLVLAILLVVWRHWIPVVLSLVFVDATMLSFGLSRTGSGIFDFTETGWNPTPWAVLSLVVEIAAAIVLIGVLALDWRDRPREALAAP